jgi:hypothetical protein
MKICREILSKSRQRCHTPVNFFCDDSDLRCRTLSWSMKSSNSSFTEILNLTVQSISCRS